MWLRRRQDVQADVSMQDGRARITLTTPDGNRYGPLTLSLRGGHQVANAIVVTRLLETARRAGDQRLDAAPSRVACRRLSGRRGWNC